VTQLACQLIEDGPGLLRRDDDRHVKGLPSHLDMLDRLFRRFDCRIPNLGPNQEEVWCLVTTLRLM
jgi:hypothetical protein